MIRVRHEYSQKYTDKSTETTGIEIIVYKTNSPNSFSTSFSRVLLVFALEYFSHQTQLWTIWSKVSAFSFVDFVDFTVN